MLAGTAFTRTTVYHSVLLPWREAYAWPGEDRYAQSAGWFGGRTEDYARLISQLYPRIFLLMVVVKRFFT